MPNRLISVGQPNEVKHETLSHIGCIGSNKLLESSHPGMGKCGNRNPKKPHVDREHLVDIFHGQIRKVGYTHAFDFDPYGKGITRSTACNAVGLVKALDFITAISHATPSLTLKYGQLKEALQEICRTREEVLEKVPLSKQSTWPGDTSWWF